MKIFLIVIAMISYSDQVDLYVIEDPNFTNPQKCVEFVKVNNVTLIHIFLCRMSTSVTLFMIL